MMVASQPLDALALVGMDAAWAGCDGLDAFERMIYEAGQHYRRVDGGNSAENIAARIGETARRALADAGIDAQNPPMRIAAITTGGTPLDAGWEWAAQAVDVSMRANPLVNALEYAQQAFAADAADAVLFAAWMNETPTGAVLALDSAQGFGFDRETHGWRLGEGGGAVVIMPLERARSEGRRVYAVIHALASAPGAGRGGDDLPSPPSLEDARGCCQAALAQAGVTAEQIGYVEAFAGGVDALDGIEIAGLVQVYRMPQQDLTTAIGSAQANTGYLGAAAGLAGLVRAALCLYHREIPAAPGWTGPKLPALWRGAPFYVPGESRAWFQPAGGRGRMAGLNVIGRGGSTAHLILGEAVDQPRRANCALAGGGFTLIPLAGNGLDDLLEQLGELRQSLPFTADLNALAAEHYDRLDADAALGLAIVGHNHDEILREIEMAIKAIPGAVEKNAEWQTPLGSYFTAAPAGRDAGVALVYPGAFNSYPGVGRDLPRLFPELHVHAAAVTNDLGHVLHERLLYPRSLGALSKDEIAALESKLLADPIAMLISGTTLAILYTHVLRETFKVPVSAAFGYSLGENSMMYATGVWGQGDEAAARLETSEAFHERLAGPQMAVREHWGMVAPDGDGQAPLWANYLVMAAPEKVLPALANEPRVYLTHINTPRQVVIGGDPAACQRVLTELHASSIQAPFDYALHCQPMRSEYDALAVLHDWPIEQEPGLKMYSAADYAPLEVAATEQAQHEIAQKMAHMLTSPLDFPRLVRQVYDDGARVFIEAGAGGNCARWVDESLKGSPHLALSLNRRGTDDASTLVRTLARLHAHRVSIDLSALYQPAFQKERL